MSASGKLPGWDFPYCLRARGMSWPTLLPLGLRSSDQNGPEIIHVRQGGAGNYRIAQCLEEAMAVIALQAGARICALRAGSRERVGGEISTGDLLRSVHSIGVAGNGMNV